jgi:uncharacterized protein YraI
MQIKIRTLILVAFLIFANLACKLATIPGIAETPPISATQQPGSFMTPGGQPAKALTSTIPPSLAPTSMQTLSHTSLPTITSTSHPTTVAARVRVEAINLRQGPGTLFPVLANVPKDEWVTVLGKARGDEWLLVESDQGQGWLATSFTDLFQNPLVISLPTIPFQRGITLQGQVKDTDGKPVAGVVFGVTQGNPPQQPRAEATSLPDGNFYVYLPLSTVGDWRISLVGVDCSSPVMDENCNYSGEFYPPWVDITIPHATPLLFTYTP